MARLIDQALKVTLKFPVVFAWNMEYRAFDQLGHAYFSHLKPVFEKYNVTGALLGNSTTHNGTIDFRAKTLRQRLELICERLKSKVHLIGYSFCGVDCRAMVHAHNGEDLVHSVSTICSPNQGSRLVEMLNYNPDAFMPSQYEQSFSILGLSPTNINEFNPLNIQSFNRISDKNPHVDYASIGSETEEGNVPEIFKFTQLMIQGSSGGYRNDGICCPQDSHFGDYLGTRHANHHEIVGIMESKFNYYTVFESIIDQLKWFEFIRGHHNPQYKLTY